MKRYYRELEDWGKHCGLCVYRYSPGDGVARYRFAKQGDRSCYFSCHGLYTALGLKEAYAWLDGYYKAICFHNN